MLEQTKLKVGEIGPASMERLIEQSRALGNESRKRVARVTLTLSRLIEHIKQQEYDKAVEAELIKMAKARPQGTLVGFANGLERYVTIAQNTISKRRVTKRELKVDDLSEEDRIKHEEYRKTMKSHFQKEDLDAEDDAIEKEMLERLSKMTGGNSPEKPAQKEDKKTDNEMLKRISAMTSKRYESVRAASSGVVSEPQPDGIIAFESRDDSDKLQTRDNFLARLSEINGLEE